jgi:hypothetical protein
MKSALKITPMFANYKYTLTGAQQEEVQMFLRQIASATDRDGKRADENAAWVLLHNLTYTESWTTQPENDIPEPRIKSFIVRMLEAKIQRGEELTDDESAMLSAVAARL